MTPLELFARKLTDLTFEFRDLPAEHRIAALRAEQRALEMERAMEKEDAL